MAKTRGSVITLKIDGVLYQGLTDKTFDASVVAEDATSQDSGGGADHNAGDYSWTVGFNSMLDPSYTQGVQQILEAMAAKTEVVVLIEGVNPGDPTITGSGTITAASLTGPHGSTAACSGTITGKGIPTFDVVP